MLSLQIKEFENWKNEEKQQMAVSIEHNENNYGKRWGNPEHQLYLQIEMEEFKKPLFAELEALQQENKKLEKVLL